MSVPNTISAQQWLFPMSALHSTPSRTTSGFSLEKELYDRARGVEFLFRLGVSLGLPSSAMFTAATWFHRFYMRCSMEDYHRQDVAASCIFLATKTEECGRKLRDVARIYRSKVVKTEVSSIADDSKELEESVKAILLTEEVLLEALCFDFVVDCPHAELVDLFDAHQDDHMVEDYAWTFANDSFRTPLCVLYSPKIIAAACHILAQHVTEGPHSPSLEARIASPAPSASLPTPPSHNPIPPEASRFAVEFFGFNEVELSWVAEALAILLDFYSAQDTQSSADYLVPLNNIRPPTSRSPLERERLYHPLAHVVVSHNGQQSSEHGPGHTPTSSHGGESPVKTPKGWMPVQTDVQPQ